MQFETLELQAQIPNTLAGKRLDQALVQLFPQYSRAKLQAWIRDKQVLVAGRNLAAKEKVCGGETVKICATLAITATTPRAEDIPLDIPFEDEHLIIVNKPVGLVVHPAAGNPDGTLVNALLHHAPQLAHLPRAGIIHRLDKGTSGLLVVAKTLEAHNLLVKQLQARTVHREYHAIAHGHVSHGGKIHAPIGRDPHHRQRMAIRQGGKTATTYYKILQGFSHYTYLQIRLDTGRTHQIRVHMASIKHPLVGDPSYGGRKRPPATISPALAQYLTAFAHQALHAIRLGLTHPGTGMAMEWTAPLPEDFQQLLNLLQLDSQHHA